MKRSEKPVKARFPRQDKSPYRPPKQAKSVYIVLYLYIDSCIFHMFLIHYAMRYSLFRPRKPRFCIILMQMYKLYARTPDPKRDDRAGVFSYCWTRGRVSPDRPRHPDGHRPTGTGTGTGHGATRDRGTRTARQGATRPKRPPTHHPILLTIY